MSVSKVLGQMWALLALRGVPGLLRQTLHVLDQAHLNHLRALMHTGWFICSETWVGCTCTADSAKFPSAQAELGRRCSGTSKISHPNPCLRADRSPCRSLLFPVANFRNWMVLVGGLHCALCQGSLGGGAARRGATGKIWIRPNYNLLHCKSPWQAQFSWVMTHE